MLKILCNFGLPALVLLLCFVLLLTGIDGEVKGILAVSAGYLFKSIGNEALKSKSEGSGGKADG